VQTRAAPLIGGRYRIEGLLGEGGMARVFDAFDERLGRRTAVKILRAETRALPGMRQRFQQEALISARLVHPHIVAVLDFGEADSSSYLVMERLPGTTLRDEIVARGPLPTERVALVMTETLAALAAAHARGVLHRDIKPSNILLQQDGHTKITDFGIAKSFDIRKDPGPLYDDMTVTGVVLGTPGYLAPERRSGHPATVQSDLYSVGAVMVESLTGRRLGSGGVAAEQLPPDLRRIASRALAPDPRHRFASASDMLQAVRTAATPSASQLRYPPGPEAATAPVPGRSPPTASGTALLTPSPSPRLPAKQRLARGRRRLTLAAIAVVAAIAALFVLLEHDVRPTGPAASLATHPTVQSKTKALTRPNPTPTTDPESSAITALASALADGGFPGDGALASALQATAAQPLGSDRQSAAAQTLSLAGVLLDGGAITSGQYADVVNVLRPTGATVTTTVTAPAQPFEVPFFQSHGHGHGRGEGDGGRG
jgi:eukaryotic-like serine/threonine-protein kinase